MSSDDMWPEQRPKKSELELMLPELNSNQLKWLEVYIALKVAEAEKRVMTESYNLYTSGYDSE